MRGHFRWIIPNMQWVLCVICINSYIEVWNYHDHFYIKIMLYQHRSTNIKVVSLFHTKSKFIKQNKYLLFLAYLDTKAQAAIIHREKYASISWTLLFCIVSVMTDNGLTTQGPMALAVMLLTLFFWNIPILPPQGSNLRTLKHIPPYLVDNIAADVLAPWATEIQHRLIYWLILG